MSYRKWLRHLIGLKEKMFRFTPKEFVVLGRRKEGTVVGGEVEETELETQLSSKECVDFR